uniref:Expressed conserved protein n=1 Tax=Globodera pallida TaxID=36090 RepID=A0A183C049_GLOPA
MWHLSIWAKNGGIRLRCSAIAVNSDEDCLKCCHMAARKERSISKAAIIGFIVDYDEMRESAPSEYKPYYRHKRSTEQTAAAAAPAATEYGQSGGDQTAPAATEYGQSGADQTAAEYGQSGGDYAAYSDDGPAGHGKSDYESKKYPGKPKNARCVCCAPKVYKPPYYGTHNGGGYGTERGDKYGAGKGYEKQYEQSSSSEQYQQNNHYEERKDEYGRNKY